MFTVEHYEQPQEKERKKKIQEKFEELKAERNVRLEERRKEKEEAAKFGEVPDSEGEESEEEPEIELKNVVLSGLLHVFAVACILNYFLVEIIQWQISNNFLILIDF